MKTKKAAPKDGPKSREETPKKGCRIATPSRSGMAITSHVALHNTIGEASEQACAHRIWWRRSIERSQKPAHEFWSA